MSKPPKYKSDAYEAIHSSASGMFRVGAIDTATMQHFDDRCLTTPPIELSATDSQVFADALASPRTPGKAMRKRVAAYRKRLGHGTDD